MRSNRRDLGCVGCRHFCRQSEAASASFSGLGRKGARDLEVVPQAVVERRVGRVQELPTAAAGDPPEISAKSSGAIPAIASATSRSMSDTDGEPLSTEGDVSPTGEGAAGAGEDDSGADADDSGAADSGTGEGVGSGA